MLSLKPLDTLAGLSFASLQDMAQFHSETSRSLLRLPSPAAPPRRRPVSRRLPSGLAAAEMLLPLGQGHRVGLVGPPGTGKSTALRMLVASQAADTAIVFAALRAKPRLESELIAVGLDKRSAPTLVFHAEPATSSTAERYMLSLAALRAAVELGSKYSHVLLAVDDLTGFAEAAADLGGVPPLSTATVVSALLDAGGNCEVAAGSERTLSVAVAMDLSPEDELPPTPRELWRSAEPSLDVCINFSRDLAAKGIFPAINVDDLSNVSPYPPSYQAPLLALLRAELRGLLSRSRETKYKLELSKDLGLHAEMEDVEALSSDSVARGLLSHSRPLSLREVTVLACAGALFHFPHRKSPGRATLEAFQADLLQSIETGHPVLWQALGSLTELSREEAGPLLRELGEALLARRFEFQLTRPDL
eukprot:TRINITY_DN16590_c0_g1_i1.p1 TRINITY_DN16590_c0_g1~~TRINITY_DN16590_c0_g1_i1.p1  ORF type:complete len:419 (+),score=77.59 TRINITY_DN16590_c0_g1_i1:441-1697(+)